MAKLDISHISFPRYEGVFWSHALRVDLIEYGVMVWQGYSNIQNSDLVLNQRRYLVFSEFRSDLAPNHSRFSISECSLAMPLC